MLPPPGVAFQAKSSMTEKVKEPEIRKKKGGETKILEKKIDEHCRIPARKELEGEKKPANVV